MLGSLKVVRIIRFVQICVRTDIFVNLVIPVQLFPGGGRPWDWNETGTRHSPGIQQADVQELIQTGATEIVLSRGMDEKLGVPDSTVRWLEDQGVKVHVAETRKAVEIYNRLLEEGVKVGGCFHSTC